MTNTQIYQVRSLHLIGLNLHPQSSLLPHLGQLQSHNNNDASHPMHFVYSAKSSLILN